MPPMKPSAVKEATEAVSHYKRKLTRNIEAPDSADIVFHCLTKLERIPVNISILQETGIGKVVNQLKKSAIGDERISSKAREIVQKWKDVVAQEEEENGDDDDDEDDDEEEAGEPEVDHHDEEVSDSADPPALEPETSTSEHVEKDESTSKHSSKSSSSKSASSSKERSSSSSKHRHESKSSSSSSSKKKKKDKDREKESERKSRDEEKSKKRKHSEHEVEESRKKKKVSDKEVSEKKDKDKHRSKEREKHRSSSKESSNKSGEALGFEAAMMAVEKKGSKSSKSSSSSSKSKSEGVSSAQHQSNGDKKKRTNLVPPIPPPLPPLFDVPCDISPNYTPIKHRPLPSVAPPKGNRMFSHITNGKTDDEALSALISMSKNAKRTAVYSGSKRSAFSDAVPSLFQLCIHVLQEHVDEIAECGGLPYDILEPVLERAKPDALMTIEDYNPYLMEDTGSLWERICRKEFPKERRQEFESWRELHERCTTARKEKLDFLTVRVQQSYKDAHTNNRKTKLAYVDEIAKPPRNVQRAQDRNGTGLVAMSARETVKSMGGPPRPRGEGRAPRGEGAAPFASLKAKPRVAPMMAKTLKMVKGLKVNFRR